MFGIEDMNFESMLDLDTSSEDSTYLEESGDDPEATKVQVGLFAEAAEELQEINTQMDLFLTKANIICETVEREYEYNCNRAQLKCLMESGTTDDLLFYEEKAEEGAVSKFMQMVNKIIEVWKEFCAKLRSRIMTKICSAKAHATISKMEKKVKINPIIARKKVEVVDPKKPIGVINKYKSKVDKETAKIIKSLGGEHTRTSLGDMKDEFRREFNKSISGKAATMTLTVAAVITELKAEVEKLPHFLDSSEKVHSEVLEKLKQTVSPEVAASATAAAQACANFRTELEKEYLNRHLDYTMDLMDALRKFVMKAKGNTQAPVVKENAEDDEIDYGGDTDIFGESADTDDGGFDTSFIDDILSSI